MPLPDAPYQTLGSVSLYLMGATASPWRGQPSRWTCLRIKKMRKHTSNNTQKLSHRATLCVKDLAKKICFSSSHQYVDTRAQRQFLTLTPAHNVLITMCPG